MSVPKTLRICVKLNAQPKQYHALTVEVELTKELQDGWDPQDHGSAMGSQVSKILEERIIAEITKFYGTAACESALAGYFLEYTKARR